MKTAATAPIAPYVVSFFIHALLACFLPKPAGFAGLGGMLKLTDATVALASTR